MNNATNDLKQLTILLVLLIASLILGCGGGNTTQNSGGNSGTGNNGGGTPPSGPGGSTGSTGDTGPGATSPMPQATEAAVNHTVELTTNQRHIDPNFGSFSISQTETFTGTAWSRFAATFWVLDPTNAQLFVNGQPFQGLLLTAQQAQDGINRFSLPPGAYSLGIEDLGNASNSAGAEITPFVSPAGTVFAGTLFTFAKSLNPTVWASQSLTVQPNTRVWLDGGNTGGFVVLMNSGELANFQSLYSAGYNGGPVDYLVDSQNMPFCNLTPTADNAPEDCELTHFLPQGQYFLVFVNSTDSVQTYTAYADQFTIQ